MNDLSRAWKGEIEEIERRKAAILAKEEAAKHERIFNQCVADLTKQGWVFRKVEQWHPHNNDTWIEQVFKSPRMKSFAPYSSKNDLIDLESKIMAATVVFSDETRTPLLDQARAVLAEYYLTNPSATLKDAPQLKVTCNIS